MQKLQKIYINNFKTLQTKTENISDIINSNALQNIYTLLTNQYAYDTQTLDQIVESVRAGVLHSSLLTIKDIANTMKEIKES